MMPRAALALMVVLLAFVPTQARAQAPAADTAHFGERSETLTIGAALPAAAPPPRLRVGVVDAPPWTVPPSKATPYWSGLASLVWRQVCEELKLEYDLTSYDEEQLAAALQRGELDVAVGAIPITPETLARFSLTPPFDQGGTSIATRVRSNFTILGVLSRMIEPEIRRWLLALLLSAFVFAFFFWLAERRRNPPIEGPALQGLGESTWWSLVTLATVGYGDRVPVTKAGKFVGAIWMAFGFVLMTVSAGVVTSLLTVDRLQPMVRGPEGLLRAKVGVVAGSPGEDYVRAAGISADRFETYEEAVDALAAERLDAIVGATDTLTYLTERQGTHHLKVLPQPLEREYAGFGLRFGLDPALEKRIALEVVKASQGDRYRALRAAMLGTTDEPASGELPKPGG
jgi:ABC-type amino acid transport substrate-binding protein